MDYPNGDLWCVRQIELLDGALEDMKNKTAKYYPNVEYKLTIPNVAEYRFKGVLSFDKDDRTIMFEQGEEFGLNRNEIVSFLEKYDIKYDEIAND